MRELTKTEIEQFDFTGLVPDLDMPARRHSMTTAAKSGAKPQAVKFQRKRRFQLGLARTA